MAWQCYRCDLKVADGCCEECGRREEECQECGVEERVSVVRLRQLQPVARLCAWCAADEIGRPYGTCTDCRGARDSDGTCACKPPRPKERS
jgi:hypothetical protein